MVRNVPKASGKLERICAFYYGLLCQRGMLTVQAQGEIDTSCPRASE